MITIKILLFVYLISSLTCKFIFSYVAYLTLQIAFKMNELTGYTTKNEKAAWFLRDVANGKDLRSYFIPIVNTFLIFFSIIMLVFILITCRKFLK